MKVLAMHRWFSPLVASFLFSASLTLTTLAKPLVEFCLDGENHLEESTGALAATAEMVSEGEESIDLHGPQGLLGILGVGFIGTVIGRRRAAGLRE